MAADANYDALAKAKELNPLIKLAKKVPVYKNGGDLALSLSNIINKYPRLHRKDRRRSRHCCTCGHGPGNRDAAEAGRRRQSHLPQVQIRG
jgi:hypothetical protein